MERLQVIVDVRRQGMDDLQEILPDVLIAIDVEIESLRTHLGNLESQIGALSNRVELAVSDLQSRIH